MNRSLGIVLACLGAIACNNTPTTGGTGGNGSPVQSPSGGAASPTGAAGTSAVASAGVGASVTNPTSASGTAGVAAPPASVGTAGTASPPATGAGTGGMASTVTAGSAATAGAAGSAVVAGSGAPPTGDVMGCGTTKLLAVPDDTSALGPWPIGARTVKIPISGGMMTAEVWYPGKPGSEAGKTELAYDLRDWLGSDKSKVPDKDNAPLACKNCFRDLPIDDAHGPYPAVVFVHGTISMRVANLSANTLWASRGFVVIAADHPGMFLSDFVGCPGATHIAQDLPRDIAAEIKALTDKSGDLAFLGDAVDMSRIGISGHSQGAGAAATAATQTNVQVDMPLADYGGIAPNSSTLKSTLLVSGLSDSIVNYSSDQTAYNGSNAPTKRIVGLTGGDHMNVTDLCQAKNSAGKTSLEVGVQYGVCTSISTAVVLFKCGTIDGATGTRITNYATSAALEETLHCQDRSKAFANIKTMFPAVGDFQHKP
jgi:dienelactone hydrolase